MTERNRLESRVKIPKRGMSKEKIFSYLGAYKGNDLDWKSGRVMGLVYVPGEKAQEVIDRAYTLYLTENGLDPLTFPSLMRLETELVAMIADLLGGDKKVVGNFTSGGTESLMLAVLTARQWARANKPEIREPEFVLPYTGHASFYKAAHYLGVKAVPVPVNGKTYRADVKAMEAAITPNTILLVGSAPGFAHGVVDPIPQIAALAREKGLLCHVDACVGGIHLSYMKKLGYKVPRFNLSVPGVTSLSVDLHKYGYAAKGASLILHRNKELRRHQFFACSRWPGYTVVNPAMTSSKTGGPLAAAWALVNFMGEDGYKRIVKRVTEATRLTVEGVEKIDGLRVLGKPDMCMFSFTSTDERVGVYRLAEKMKTLGWLLQPQFARGNSPANLHISMSQSFVPHAKKLLRDLKACVESLRHEEPTGPSAATLLTGMKDLSMELTSESFEQLTAMAGIKGDALPERMESINELLEILPDDIAEFMLIEFLNNIMTAHKSA